MPKKKKVTKAEAKASIKRLHKASKRESSEQQEVTIEPVATRELPPQPFKKRIEVTEVVPEEIEAPVEVQEVPEVQVEETPEEQEEPETDHSHKRMVIGEAIESGWNSVKSHVWFFIAIFLLFTALSFMSISARAIGTRVVLSLLISGISLGCIKLAIDVVDGKSPEFKELFSCFSLLLKYVVAAILYAIVVAFGLALFVIPGIIWAVQFGFYPFVIVKERLGPLAALRKSSKITEGVKGRLVIFSLALFGINLLGVIALGIGVIVTIPLSVIAAAHVFKQLESA
jgi:hypothetical protein